MNNTSHIIAPVEAEFETCKRTFDQFMVHENVLLNEVLQHVKQRKGKMMRPLLTLLSAKMFGKIDEKCILTALTFEFFHTASLMHDDVVDESELRRGRPSVNAAYTNQIAVLVGDFILANAVECASKTKDPKLFYILSQTAKQLADGELLQMSNMKVDDTSVDTYIHIISGKTAALFAACSEMGAETVGASEEDVRTMKEFGQIVGLCFQIRDDIFDYFSEAEIGKPTGNDMREGKLTLPLIHALNVTNDTEMLHLTHIMKQGGATSQIVHKLVDFAKTNGGIDYAFGQMKQLADRAHGLLERYPDSDVSAALHNYVDYVIARNY